MVIKISKDKKKQEIKVLSDMCESTLKKNPSGNIMEFISRKENIQSAKLMNWGVTTVIALIANNMMFEWSFDEVSKEDAEKTLEVLTMMLKRLQEFI